MTHLKDPHKEYSFFHHQRLKHKREVRKVEKRFITSLSAKNAVERKLIDRHLDLSDKQNMTILESLAAYDLKWKARKTVLPSLSSTPRRAPRRAPRTPSPPSSPTLSNSSVLLTPSSTNSLGHRGPRSPPPSPPASPTLSNSSRAISATPSSASSSRDRSSSPYSVGSPTEKNSEVW